MMDTAFRLNEKTIWRLVNAAFLVCIGLFGGGSFLGITSLRLIHILTAFAVILALVFLSNMTVRMRLLCLVGIGLILLGAVFTAGFQNCFSFLQSYFYWLTGSPLWVREQLTGYELLQTIFLTLACYLVQLGMEKDFRLKITGALALLAVLLYHLFAERELGKVSVAFILCYMVLLCVEGTQLRWKKEKSRSLPAYMLWLLPFLGIYFLMLLLPSVPEKPYDWQIVKNAYHQLWESVLKFSYNFEGFGGEEYDLTLSGFSGKSVLGGALAETNREIMNVQSGSKLAANVYLTGKIYDTFDGREWLQQNESDLKARYLDTIETLHAVWGYDGDYLGDYLHQANLTISYRHFRSEFLFAPLKTISLKQSHENMEFQESGGNLFFGRRKGYGTEYEASFYQMNTGQEIFRAFLKEAGSLEQDEDGFKRLFREQKARSGIDLDMTDLEAYRQGISQNYLENIALSDEVKEYLREITADAETEVDRLCAIERELSSFNYTRSPGELPENVTDAAGFLDYFLLEKREGHCTYFATAFTLLARAEGFPARFVQGFCVPLKGSRETNVYSNMAHAWPEVYFEGIGWVPFEPTPGYSENRYASWMPENRNTGSAADLNNFPTVPERRVGTASDRSSEEMEKSQEAVIYPEGNSAGQILRTISLVLLLVLGFAILILLLNRLIAVCRYRKMTIGARFRTEFSRNMRILALLGSRRKETETLTEFKHRMEQSAAGKHLQFLDSYEEFLYGDREIIPHTLDEAKRQQQALLLLLKQEKRWAYICYRVLEGK